MAMRGADAFVVPVCDRGEEQELIGGEVEPLFVDAALAEEHCLTAVEHRVHRRAPLLERDAAHVVASLARTAGRRSGGIVFGGCRLGGNASRRRVVVAVTSATAASKASALAAV